MRSEEAKAKRQAVNDRTFLRHGHGRSGKASRTYRIWQNMRSRCQQKSCGEYWRYGGSGISVCAPWNDFRNFLADMGEAPAGHSIDRIDNSRGYEPENCRWATPLQQALNCKRTNAVTINGDTRSLRQWCLALGRNYANATYRVRECGMSPLEALEDVA